MLYPVVKPVLEKSENCLSYKPVTKVTLTLLPDTPRTFITPSAEPREVTCDSFRGGGSQISNSTDPTSRLAPTRLVTLSGTSALINTPSRASECPRVPTCDSDVDISSSARCVACIARGGSRTGARAWLNSGDNSGETDQLCVRSLTEDGRRHASNLCFCGTTSRRIAQQTDECDWGAPV
ncbi:hypothetical protein V1264_003511 [Littorina saxatilis]|uniref:Uncharacterized protein n=1 Tax=Littorina saxatilis TaxID=31220 RepID=A0AAN9G8D1_9CAEN